MAHGEITERDAAKLAKEYVSKKTGEVRRSEILATLGDADPLLLQRTLKKSIRDDDERHATMELAAELGVPGLTDLVWKYFDEEPDLAMDYLVGLQEGDTAEKLVERWGDEATDGAVFKGLTQRFQNNWLPLDLAPLFRDSLEDPDRGESALAILRYQLNAPEVSAEDLVAGWDDRMKALMNDAKEFERKGKPLFELPFDLQGAKSVRRNYELQPGKITMLKEFPEDWSSRSFTIRLRIRADEAEHIEVNFTTTDASQNARFIYTKDRWFFEFTTGESAEKKVDHTKWVELELHVINEGDKKNVDRRRCNLLVDGEELKIKARYYTLNAPLRALTLNMQLSHSPALVGGADWWYE
ncbi:MAG: hypothetical protein KDB90_02835 [Planctomycetes bacterium]|nr:hypothetical protein [Planctomycetota bacterium]